jgi:hypothetical protein
MFVFKKEYFEIPFMQISMLQNFLMREGNLRTGERVPKFSLQGPRLQRIVQRV